MAIPPLDISKKIVDFFEKATVGTLSGIRDILDTSMGSTANRLSELTDKPLVKFTEIQGAFQKAASQLNTANQVTAFGLATAIQSVTDAFDSAGNALRIADEFTHKHIFENVHISSTAGTSFDALLKTKIVASFRLQDADCSAQQIAEAVKASGKTSAVLFVPGLFCDDGMWTQGPEPLLPLIESMGYASVLIRLHPGLPISENGQKLVTLLDDLFANIEIPLHIISFSNGGLILRSCLYYAKLAGKPWLKHLRKVAIISPPDGGSYIEKLGFWLGLALKSTPSLGLQLLGWVGHMRSDAMKDLSHGIIRQEDRHELSQIKRYGVDLYYNELDDLDAYLIYSLISESNDPVKTWLGDGVCEKKSLEYLRESVYLKKPNPEKRVRVIAQKSHFQILSSAELRMHLKEIFS